MKQHHISRRTHGALAVTLAAGVLIPMAAGEGTAAAAAPKVSCTSAKAGLAAKLTKDITKALQGRSSTVGIALHDNATKTTCTLRGNQQFDSASVVKTTILSTLLWDADKHHRKLTKRETDLAYRMITRSLNDPTTALWDQLGHRKISAFLKAAGMNHTVLGNGGLWGLTQITAQDQEKLLTLLTNKNKVLTDSSRGYVLDLMSKVVADQRWGTPAGAPKNVTVHVKNGWLQRTASRDWRINSIGAFTGHGRNYTMAVLTQNNRTMDGGIATVQAVARAIHKDLNPAVKPAMLIAPPAHPQEVMPPLPRS